MRAGRFCHQHAEQPLMAYCDRCSRPCCRDCAVELFERYFCGKCRDRIAGELQFDAVQPEALSAVVLAGIGMFLAGALLGPYALWRSYRATQSLERTPWLRGRWHIRAAMLLGALGFVQGLIFFASRWLVV